MDSKKRILSVLGILALGLSLILGGCSQFQSSENEKQNSKSIVEGIEMTLKEILRIFEKFGVKPIESCEKSFDPNYHQAVMREESDAYSENTVLRELQKGYLLHDRLLRPAMVVVTAPMTAEKKEEEGNSSQE